MSSQRPPGAGRSPLLFIFLTVFIDLLGFGIVIPLLPVYSKMHAASELQLGLLFSCFSGMQFLFAPMWGRLSDRIGRRKVLIGGLIGTAASYLLFAHADSMNLLFASRLLAGFFGGNVSAAQAYIADVTTEKDRAKGMGLIGAAFGLGFTFGPFLGGVMGKYSTALPGYVAAGLSLTAAMFGWFKLTEPARQASDASRLFSSVELRRALVDGRIRTLLVLNFLAIFAFSAFEGMLTRFGIALFPRAFHVPEGEIATAAQLQDAALMSGMYMFFVGLISALIQGGLIRRLVPKYGETRLAIAGPAFLAVALLLVGLAPQWWVAIAGCVLLPCGFGLTNPSLAGLVSRASPKERQGAYMGMNQSTSSLARFTGPPIAGFLFGAYGPRAPFVVAAGVVAVASLLAAAYRARYGATFESPE